MQMYVRVYMYYVTHWLMYSTDADSLKTHQVDKFGQQKEDLQVNSRTNIESFLQDRNQVKKRAITDTSTGKVAT